MCRQQYLASAIAPRLGPGVDEHFSSTLAGGSFLKNLCDRKNSGSGIAVVKSAKDVLHGEAKSASAGSVSRFPPPISRTQS
jgi:hypothetical protein